MKHVTKIKSRSSSRYQEVLADIKSQKNATEMQLTYD